MVNQETPDPAFTVFLAYLSGRSVREQTIADYRRQLQAVERRAAHLRVMLHALVVDDALAALAPDLRDTARRARTLVHVHRWRQRQREKARLMLESA